MLPLLAPALLVCRVDCVASVGLAPFASSLVGVVVDESLVQEIVCRLFVFLITTAVLLEFLVGRCDFLNLRFRRGDKGFVSFSIT